MYASQEDWEVHYKKIDAMVGEFAAKSGGGAVRIFRQQQSMPAAVHIGNVNAVVGAEKAMMGLGDEYAVLAPYDGAAPRSGCGGGRGLRRHRPCAPRRRDPCCHTVRAV